MYAEHKLIELQEALEKYEKRIIELETENCKLREKLLKAKSKEIDCFTTNTSSDETTIWIHSRHQRREKLLNRRLYNTSTKK